MKTRECRYLTHQGMLPAAFWTAAILMFAGSLAAQEQQSRGPYGVKAPVALFQPLPAYTDEARQAGIEGIDHKEAKGGR